MHIFFWVNKGNKDLNLEEEEGKRNLKKSKANEEDTKRLDPGVLEKYFQIHDDDLVFMFLEGKLKNLTWLA